MRYSVSHAVLPVFPESCFSAAELLYISETASLDGKMSWPYEGAILVIA
jgi:hypothetical protein